MAHCEGTLWFYCSDMPYMHFQVDKMNLFINFTTASYHRPIGNLIIPDRDDDESEEERKDGIERYKPFLPHCRTWVFHTPESKLAIENNMGQYKLVYGYDRHAVLHLDLTPNEAQFVAVSMDAVFEQGLRDSHGDFKQSDDQVIEFGIGMCLKYNTTIWNYARTEHPEQSKKYKLRRAVRLPKGTQVRVLKNSSSIVL